MSQQLTGKSDWLTRVLLTATFSAMAWDMHQRAHGHTLQEIARVALIVAAIAGVISLAFWLVLSPKLDAEKAARKHLLAQLDEERAQVEREQTAYRVVAPVGSRRTLRRRRERNSP